MSRYTDGPSVMIPLNNSSKLGVILFMAGGSVNRLAVFLISRNHFIAKRTK